MNCVEMDDNGKATVCSGHGMCVADPSAGFVRCVCDEAWEGAQCGRATSDGGDVVIVKEAKETTGFSVTIVVISLLLVVVGVAVAYLYRRNKTLEKYAVPILDEHEQIEPTMGGVDDSDSDDRHFRERKQVRPSPKEMVS